MHTHACSNVKYITIYIFHMVQANLVVTDSCVKVYVYSQYVICSSDDITISHGFDSLAFGLTSTSFHFDLQK